MRDNVIYLPDLYKTRELAERRKKFESAYEDFIACCEAMPHELYEAAREGDKRLIEMSERWARIVKLWVQMIDNLR